MGQSRGRVVVSGVLAVVSVAAGGLIGLISGTGPVITPDYEVTTEPPADEESVRVHVSGMVVSPGVVDVAPEAIVADAIDSAGGLLREAVVDQLNLAAPVNSGDQIVVPGPDTADAGTGGDSGDGVLSLNRAGATELESLPGVGPVLAERIVSFREENGAFETVDELLEVSGIGEAKLGSIRDLVRP